MGSLPKHALLIVIGPRLFNTVEPFRAVVEQQSLATEFAWAEQTVSKLSTGQLASDPRPRKPAITDARPTTSVITRPLAYYSGDHGVPDGASSGGSLDQQFRDQ